MKSIGKKVRQRREALGLTQAQVAEEAQISRSWVVVWEDENFVDGGFFTLHQIADALDCDLVVKLKPRDKIKPGDEQAWKTIPEVIAGGVSVGYTERKSDPEDAEIQAKMQEIVAKMQALPWELVGNAELCKHYALALAKEGDFQTAMVYLGFLKSAFGSAAVCPEEPRFMGVDYAAGVDHTESIGIVRLDDQTLTRET